jgi:hypothetical protein
MLSTHVVAAVTAPLIAVGVMAVGVMPAEAALPSKRTTYTGPLKGETKDGIDKVGKVVIRIGKNRQRIKLATVKTNICGTPSTISFEKVPIGEDGTFEQSTAPFVFSGEFVTRNKATGSFQEFACTSGVIRTFTAKAVE